MAEESIMGIAAELTTAVIGKLSLSKSAEDYGERIGRLFRAVLREVEEGRKEILTSRRESDRFPTGESTDIERNEQ